MVNSRFLPALRNGPMLGGWVSLDTPAVLEIMAHLGFDYVGIDCQHSLIDPVAAARLLFQVAPDGPPVLVRPTGLDRDQIGKLLDAGADGVIIPMVNNAEQARAAVSACRYPPQGDRSFGPIRARTMANLRTDDVAPACFVMAETREAIANIEAICATPGLDGVYVGPSDLALDLGLRIDAHAPPPAKLRDAMRHVSKACHDAGIVAATHAYPATNLPLLMEDGFTLVTLGSDQAQLAAAAAADLLLARSHAKGMRAE